MKSLLSSTPSAPATPPVLPMSAGPHGAVDRVPRTALDGLAAAEKESRLRPSQELVAAADDQVTAGGEELGQARVPGQGRSARRARSGRRRPQEPRPFIDDQRQTATVREVWPGVNVSSVAGLTALPTGAPYGVAKAGLIQLTRNLAREWGRHGVTVNAVAPWYVPTPLTEGVLAAPAFREAVLQATPVGRLGTPEEVAAAVAFLLGPEAGWISGVCLPLDGGFTAASFFPVGG